MNELSEWIRNRINALQEEINNFEEILYDDYEKYKMEIIIRNCEICQLQDVLIKMNSIDLEKEVS